MRTWRAIAAGLVGGVLAIAILRGAAWISGGDADLCALLGAVMTGDTGTAAWIAGCVLQLVAAVAAAIAYAAIFEWVIRRAGAMAGVLIAVPHVVVAGLAMGFLPASRLLDAGFMPPGAVMEYRGVPVLAGFVLAHLTFGAVVGLMYGDTRHVVRETTFVWHDLTDGEGRHPARE
jgi:hypothetical protein